MENIKFHILPKSSLEETVIDYLHLSEKNKKGKLFIDINIQIKQ